MSTNRPTLGGLKKAQEFLRSKGYSMPVFQVDIYDRMFALGKGRTVSLDEEIDKCGVMHEVVDVRLTTKNNNKFVHFSSKAHCGPFIMFMGNPKDVIVGFHKGDPIDQKFKEFMESKDGDIFMKISRWGKASPSMIDRFKFRFFPKRYASEIFA